MRNTTAINIIGLRHHNNNWSQTRGRDTAPREWLFRIHVIPLYYVPSVFVTIFSRVRVQWILSCSSLHLATFFCFHKSQGFPSSRIRSLSPRPFTWKTFTKIPSWQRPFYRRTLSRDCLYSGTNFLTGDRTSPPQRVHAPRNLPLSLRQPSLNSLLFPSHHPRLAVAWQSVLA